jgi:hypothetical protein
MISRNKLRRDLSEYKALIASPGNLASGFQLPANGSFSVSYNQTLASPDGVLELGNRTISCVGAPGTKGNTVVGEEGMLVKKVTGKAGTVSLFLLSNFGKRVLIGVG